MESHYLQVGVPRDLSVLYHFSNAAQGENRGIDFRSGEHSAFHQGVCLREFRSEVFTVAGLQRSQTAAEMRAADRSAAQHRVLRGGMAYMYGPPRVRRAEDILDALFDHGPVVLGIKQTQGYADVRERGATIHGPAIELPSAHHHAVVAVGYDSARDSLLILDSFGTNIGDQGRWYLPYPLIDSVVLEATYFYGVTT